MSGVREATHAGSWYTSSGSRLRAELEGYIRKVTPIPALSFTTPLQDAKAIIAPHAGYSYSGPAAAWAYASIPSDKIKRVFLLGPSHHVYLSGIALSRFAAYGTPLGDIPLDLETIAELRGTKLFSEMKPSVDEEEHSLEMHLPYIRQVFGSNNVKLVPLLVGHPPASQTDAISATLAKYWDDPETFFIISSDFCHWGTRFSCTPYYPHAPDPPNPVPPVEGQSAPLSSPPEMVKRFANPGATPIWKSIQYMDHEGMDLLRKPALKGAVDAWESYLARTKNTICGRNPITVLLNLMQYRYGGKAGAENVHFNFVRYEQSSRCMTGRDSSVSYVSGVLRPSP